MRYVWACLIVFCAVMLLFGWALGAIAKRADQILDEETMRRLRRKEFEPSVRTVMWCRHGNVRCAYRGAIVPLDDDVILIDGRDGPVLVRTADILAVMH